LNGAFIFHEEKDMNKQHINFFGLLTDFGFDFAVASMKGVLLQALPDARIIDIDHTIEKFNIINAAFVIDKVYRFLPDTTILICVVDPGVGSERDILYVEADGYRFIGPNNGIFHHLLTKQNTKVYAINQQLFNSESVTFHGRDIFSPAAIRLAQGDQSMLKPIDRNDIVLLDNLGDQITTGVITYIDSFGNIKTNIKVQDTLVVGNYVTLFIDDIPYTINYTHTFAQVLPGELLCYKGSNGTLEIAVNYGSAQEKLDVRVGAKICMQ
jgi:S-adenosylmethionine hydrolase